MTAKVPRETIKAWLGERLVAIIHEHYDLWRQSGGASAREPRLTVAYLTDYLAQGQQRPDFARKSRRVRYASVTSTLKALAVEGHLERSVAAGEREGTQAWAYEPPTRSR